MDRHEIVLDLETNGRHPKRHVVTEVAWWNLTTDQRGHFFPDYSWDDVMRHAEPDALIMTQYLERIWLARKDEGVNELGILYGQLAGNPYADVLPATIVAANPAFDTVRLRRLFKKKLGGFCWSDRTWDTYAPWHHRTIDIETYAKAVLNLPYVPSLARLCELLGLRNAEDVMLAPDHTAQTDVLVTGLAYKELQRIRHELGETTVPAERFAIP